MVAVVARKSKILDAQGDPMLVEVGGSRRFPSSRAIPWQSVLARYDAAQTTDDNLRHWAWSDSLSPDQSNSPAIRRTLRNRSRYEAANNSYCRSMVETLANDVIGTGPRIQITTGMGKRVDQWIERELAFWMQMAKIAKRLRLMRKSKCDSGEGTALMVTKPKLPTPVKLGLRTLETEQVASPDWTGLETGAVDGVQFDADGDPISYDILRQHPGDTSAVWLQADRLPASDVIHIFREDRSGQHRGIPELTPALPLFAQLRRFTLATLAAAETAAEFAAVVETQRPEGGTLIREPDGTTTEALSKTFDTFELAQRMVTVLPEGTKLSQIDAKHPATTYGEFKREILAEAFAAVVMPYAVGANDSKEYNFASGKLDRRGYARAVVIERALDWSPEIYRLVYSWYLEARLIARYLPAGLPPFSQWTVQVHWDKVEDDIDPVKAASARQVELETGQTSFRRHFAERNMDCETVQDEMAADLGMDVASYRRRIADKLFGNGGSQAVAQPKSRPVDESDDEDSDE